MNGLMKVNIANITTKVFPDLKIKPALDLFNKFKKQKYPELHDQQVYDMIMFDNTEYDAWLHAAYLRHPGLNEERFEQFLSDIKKLSINQLRIASAVLKRYSDWKS